MFETLKPQPADKILALVQMFKEDPRPQKIDLGVGVYKNAEGVTPVMRAVKAAEHQLWQDETTKAYVGLTGDPAFSDGMIKMILGDAVPRGAVAAAGHETNRLPQVPLLLRAFRGAAECGAHFLADGNLLVRVRDPARGARDSPARPPRVSSS